MSIDKQRRVQPLCEAPGKDFVSFLDVPVDTDIDNLVADAAILGVPYGIPYAVGQGRSASAPDYIRKKSHRFMRATGNARNLDRDCREVNLSNIIIADCGNVFTDPANIHGSIAGVTEAVKKILRKNAVPIVFGGDDAIPIPVIRAYEEFGPIVVIQIDEHLDFADEINGVREGYSSPMRRVSEMPWVKQTVQIGLHGFTCAKQFATATDAGNILITENEVHDRGIDAILEQIPSGENYFITVDFDGLDPAVFPAVSHPEPGGLNYHETRDLLSGLAKKGRIAGIDFAEMVPDHDLNGLSGHTVGRLVVNMLHAMIEARQFVNHGL